MRKLTNLKETGLGKFIIALMNSYFGAFKVELLSVNGI